MVTFGTNPVQSPDYYEQQRYNQFLELQDRFGGEEQLQQTLRNLLNGVKDYNSELYTESFRDQLKQNEDNFYNAEYSTNPSYQADLKNVQSNLVKDRIYELYLPGIQRGENQVLDEIISDLYYKDLETPTNAYEVALDQFRNREAEELSHTSRQWQDQYGGWATTVPIAFNLAFAALTFGASAGQFSFLPGGTDPGFEEDFSNPDSNIPTGWGEDYASGPDQYFDPETGEIGTQDPNGGIPGYEDGEYVGPTIPDFTRPDPVKEGIPATSGAAINDYPSFASNLNTGSFGEYGYSKFQAEGATESKLGNFGNVKSFDEVEDSLTGPSIMSKWIEAMPNMPKAASFLYPR